MTFTIDFLNAHFQKSGKLQSQYTWLFWSSVSIYLVILVINLNILGYLVINLNILGYFGHQSQYTWLFWSYILF